MNELMILLLSAASLGFIHTLLGPDHYLPFIVLGRARGWSQSRTLWITTISGIGHVAGSIILGIIGVALGLSVSRLEEFEAGRGSLVGWMLMGFGLLYLLYGAWVYMRGSTHIHLPSFLKPRAIRNQDLHHMDSGQSGQAAAGSDPGSLSPWLIFLIFVFGPCEVLIPVLIYPASEHSGWGVALVALVFGLATVLTMLLMVLLGYRGVSLFNFKGRGYMMHILAGVVILVSGIAMTFLGL